MCHQTTARPPSPPDGLRPIGGGAGHGELITLEACDDAWRRIVHLIESNASG